LQFGGDLLAHVPQISQERAQVVDAHLAGGERRLGCIYGQERLRRIKGLGREPRGASLRKKLES
jgi:hypothetical protein